MKRILFAFGFLICSLSIYSQAVSEKVYLDTSAYLSNFTNMLINQDGSMTFCGAIMTDDSIPKHRALMMKLNNDYSLRWIKSFQKQDSTGYFLFNDIFPVNDTAYFVSYLAGQSSEIRGYMLIDSAGNILYGKEIADTIQPFYGGIKDVFQENDSTYLFSLNHGSSVHSILLKVNLNGDVLAQRTFNNAQPPYNSSIIKLFDGNYLYVTHDHNGPYDVLHLHCLNSNLDTVWNKGYYEGPYWAAWRSNGIIQLSDSSIWMIGRKNTDSIGGDNQPVISKFSSDGEMIWSKKYLDTTAIMHSLWNVKELNGKIYVLTALYNNFGMVVFDTSGQVLLKQTYNHGNAFSPMSFNIKSDSLLMGFIDYQSDEFGFILVDTNLVRTCSSDDLILNVDTMNPTPMNYSSYVSSTLKFVDVTDIYTVFTPALIENAFCVQSAIDELKTDNINVYPNPASHLIHIVFPESYKESTIQISDLYGRTVFEKVVMNSIDFSVDISQYRSGVYFATIRTSTGYLKSVSFVKI